jgi:hypothetical protein
MRYKFKKVLGNEDHVNRMEATSGRRDISGGECNGNMLRMISSLNLPGAGIAQSVQRLSTSWAARARFPVGARDFSLVHSVQTGSRAHPTSYLMGTSGSFPRVVKRLGREAEHSQSSSAEVKNWGAIPPPSQTPSQGGA